MAKLTTAELALVDTLFGMYGGYVLEFSNDRFAAFFVRDVGVQIYDDKYAAHGNSKGKRLWGFLEIAPPPQVVRALSALWETRESERMGKGQSESIPHARARLSALITKLGGTALGPSFDEAKSAPAASEVPKGPSILDLESLEGEFLRLTTMDETPQARGYAFERFLKQWCDVWGLDPHAAFKLKGEQIDGSLQHDGNTYLVEAKWHVRPIDAGMLHGFQGKLLERPDWTRGLYVSYGGFSGESFDAFTARRLIMMDGTDIYYALHRHLDLGEVIRKKVRHHTERRQPFAKVTDLFPS